MIRHIVMWQLKDHAEGASKAENARLIKTSLEALNGKIPGMRVLEIGVDISRTEHAADLVLYSEFDSLAALAAYDVHPDHLALKPLVLARRAGRLVVDYDTEASV